MGRYFLDAKSHADKIDHYHKTAGASGYSKARFHGAKLSEIMHRASRTDKGRRDVFSISVLLKKTNIQLDEMRQREIDAAPATEPRKSESPAPRPNDVPESSKEKN